MRVKDQELKDLPLRLKMSIKKSRNLEDVFSTYDSSQIETKGNIEVTNSGNLKKAIKFYENELNKNELSHYKYFPFKQYNNKEAKSIILDSSELDQFLKLTTIHEEDKNYQIVTGLILTQFIKNSNLKGNNNFELNPTTKFPLKQFGKYLTGENDPLKIEYNGCLIEPFINSANLDLIINGDIKENIGYGSNNCKFEINGAILNTGFRNLKGAMIYLNGDINLKYKLPSGKFNDSFRLMDKSYIIVKEIKKYRQLKSLFFRARLAQMGFPGDTEYENHIILQNRTGDKIKSKKVKTKIYFMRE